RVRARVPPLHARTSAPARHPRDPARSDHDLRDLAGPRSRRSDDMTEARRWVAAAALLVLVAGGALASGQVSGTFAVFTADPTSVTGTNISDWWCFRIHATSATVWTSPTVAFTPLRILVPTSMTLNNKAGQTVGTMEAGDTITVNYNQAVSVSGTVTVNSCAN